jgi:hypothetical protein
MTPRSHACVHRAPHRRGLSQRAPTRRTENARATDSNSKRLTGGRFTRLDGTSSCRVCCARITALALLFPIAAWAFILGVLRLNAAVQMRHEVHEWWLSALSGALSIAFAVLLVITPGAGALVISWLIGWFALFLGVMLLMLAFRVRKVQRGAGVGGVRPVAA